jgi:hypothetical protein
MTTIAITGTAGRVHARLHHGIARHRAGDVVHGMTTEAVVTWISMARN